MRVLYILHNKLLDGSLLSFFNMAEGLKLYGVEVCIACPEELMQFDQFKDRVERDAFKVFPMFLYASVYAKPHSLKDFYTRVKDIRWILYFKHKSYREILQLARELNPDIIHTNDSVIQEGYSVSKRLNIPHVWHVREYVDICFDYCVFPSMTSLKKKLRRSNVVTISNNLLDYFNLSNCDNACVIYNGVAKKEDACVYTDKKKYFLCASRVSPEKHIDDVICAFDEFSKICGDFTLKIAGFGNEEYIEQLKLLANKKNRKKSVEFLGFRDDIKSLMSEAAALIVASPFEGFGRMTAEASFYGCMVIGKNSGGTKEILDKTGGLFFDDVENLSKQMRKVAEMSADEYHKIVDNAQQIAVECFSVEQNVERIYQLYQKVFQ